jgi:hypothetical protein
VTATTSAARPPIIEPEAALALLELAAREVRLAAIELDYAAPHSVLFLANTLEQAVDRSRIDAFQVELARRSTYQARRCDLAEAFHRLNPGFGRVHDGCWPTELDSITRYDAKRQRRAQRRELELCMGERFAAMLAPASEGGEAA